MPLTQSRMPARGGEDMSNSAGRTSRAHCRPGLGIVRDVAHARESTSPLALAARPTMDGSATNPELRKGGQTLEERHLTSSPLDEAPSTWHDLLSQARWRALGHQFRVRGFGLVRSLTGGRQNPVSCEEREGNFPTG